MYERERERADLRLSRISFARKGRARALVLQKPSNQSRARRLLRLESSVLSVFFLVRPCAAAAAPVVLRGVHFSEMSMRSRFSAHFRVHSVSVFFYTAWFEIVLK